MISIKRTKRRHWSKWTNWQRFYNWQN